MIEKAVNNGISSKGQQRCKAMFNKFRDAFRINLEADPPARVEPFRIKLKPNHRPVHAKQRRYPPPQHAFISATVMELEAVGAIRPNPQARWASPVLVVPKHGTEKFSFNVNLRAPNRETVPIASAMPDLEQLIQPTAGSQVYAKMDTCHAYWQLPLHKDSHYCTSIQSPIGVYTPHRLLHGQTDAGNHFQGVASPIFSSAIDRVAQWLDDFLLHAQSEEQLLKYLELSLKQCREYGLKLQARKCELFLKEATFCGRAINWNGVRYSSKDLDTLLSMRKP